MRLIENARYVWKFYSTHAQAIAAAIPVAYATLPAEWLEIFPEWLLIALPLIVFVSGVVGRVVKQDGLLPASEGELDQ